MLYMLHAYQSRSTDTGTKGALLFMYTIVNQSSLNINHTSKVNAHVRPNS